MKQALGEKEIRDLLKEVDCTRDKLMVKLLLDTGMTISEFTRVKLHHIKEDSIYIPKANTKQGKARQIRANPELLGDIKLYCNLHSIRSSYIWRGYRNHGHMATRTIQLMLKKYGARIGLDISPQTLRETHIRRALDKDIPLQYIQAQVGKKNIVAFDINMDNVRLSYDEVGF